MGWRWRRYWYGCFSLAWHPPADFPVNYRLDFSYDGSDFFGYAIQPDLRTVQGDLEEALAKVLGSTATHVAGRTDAGVHARHQVVSVTAERETSPGVLQRALNRMLGPEIVISSLTEVDESFHARYSAVSRTYRYFILNRQLPDPFLARTRWHYRYPLDLAPMNAAIGLLLGERDFSSFCRVAEGKSPIRRVEKAEWGREGEEVVLEITANSFCHQMVRSLVRECVELGRGNGEPQDIVEIADARDRNLARGVAPARGLFLWQVNY